MQVVVTGGAGFIGSTLVDRLLASGHSVVVFDDLSSGSLANLQDAQRFETKFQFHEFDITNPEISGKIAALQPEVVFHLAAQIDVRLSVEDPAKDAMVNIIGALHVLEGARLGNAQRFVFASSGGAIYGDAPLDLLPFDESVAQRPSSPYGVSKKALLDYLEVYRQLYGLPWVAIAPSNVYGPRQNFAGEGGVVAIFCHYLSEGQPATIFGDGNATRDYIYVDDVVSAMLQAIDHGSGLYNISTGVETSLLQLHEVIQQAAGVNSEPIFASERPGDIRRSVLNNAKARRELQWTPQIALADGVKGVLGG